MAVTISQDQHGTIIQYAGDKRPIKIEPFVIKYEEDSEILQQVMGFVVRESNAPHHLAKMEESKFYALVERLSVMACRKFSPLRNWGVSKQEIRGIVLFVLQAGIAAGEWPTAYEIRHNTFVQDGRGRLE
ncbi:hypothetical protein [Paenibacillus aceti]|uniref:Uncharacterized protein n=1 Tax=Paenibacillus aceti TaxID=1820010 RepID=A0ABQ1W0L0_9BACL|nr:hypothetical protein [Paenibacillus aceti]GGG08635.1 hypothetical protein GCM10010913_33000 [Paenibacillus aceti]